jgi:hypothetical protein
VLIIGAGTGTFRSLLAEDAELGIQCQAADVVQQAQRLPAQGRELPSIPLGICWWKSLLFALCPVVKYGLSESAEEKRTGQSVWTTVW